MEADYLNPTNDNAHDYLIILTPVSCDLALSTVQDDIFVANGYSLAAFSLRVVSKLAANNYKVQIVLQKSVLTDAYVDIGINEVSGTLKVPKTLIMSSSLKGVSKYAPSFNKISDSSFGAIFTIGINIVLWPMMTFRQFIGYFIYLNTVFPAQVELFLSVFTTNWNDFLPNPLGFVTDSLSSDIQAITGNSENARKYQPPAKFIKYGITSFFIETGTPVLTLNFILLILITCLRIARKHFSLRRFPILRYIYINIRWNFIFRLFLENGAPLALSTFLQLRRFSWINVYTTISVGLSIISLLYIVFMAQFILGMLQDRDPEHLNTAKIRRLYSTLYENIHLNNSASKYYHTMMFFRSMLITFMVSFVENMPYLQILPLIGFNIILVYYLFFKISFEKSNLNKINRMKEVLILIAEVFIFCLNFEGKSEGYYSALGWIMIALLSVAVITEFVYTIIIQFRVLKKIFVNRKTILKDIKLYIIEYEPFTKCFSRIRNLFGGPNRLIQKQKKDGSESDQTEVQVDDKTILDQSDPSNNDGTDLQAIEAIINNLKEEQASNSAGFNNQVEMQMIEKIIKGLAVDSQQIQNKPDDELKVEDLDKDDSNIPPLDPAIRKRYFHARTIDEIEINTNSVTITPNQTLDTKSFNMSLLNNDTIKLNSNDMSPLMLEKQESHQETHQEEQGDLIVVNLGDEEKL